MLRALVCFLALISSTVCMAQAPKAYVLPTNKFWGPRYHLVVDGKQYDMHGFGLFRGSDWKEAFASNMKAYRLAEESNRNKKIGGVLFFTGLTSLVFGNAGYDYSDLNKGLLWGGVFGLAFSGHYFRKASDLFLDAVNEYNQAYPISYHEKKNKDAFTLAFTLAFNFSF